MCVCAVGPGRGNRVVLEAVLGALRSHLPQLLPEALAMQGPGHWQLDSTTTHIPLYPEEQDEQQQQQQEE